jgi:4-amino-4-deoxy-L-arabinose transferase-like glycosyltransferase
VATDTAVAAASIELATGQPVIAMGGFSGRDPAMTVDRLRALVRSGRLRYVVTGGLRAGPGGAATSVSVTSWVTQHCVAVDSSSGTGTGGTLYDCGTAG